MIYLIAGHNGPGTGAKGLNGADEGEMTIELRDDIAKNLREDGVRVITDDDTKPLRSVLMWLGNLVTPKDIVCDIHFNAFHRPTAHGCEVIIPNNPNTMEIELAKELTNAISSSLGIRDRGVKSENLSQHKTIGILSGKPRVACNVLLEICFITNADDLKAYDENQGQLILCVSEVLAKYSKLQ